MLVGALLEDYVCLYLLGQHVETPYCDLVIILVVEIEWFLRSLPVFITSWVLGFRLQDGRRDVQLNRIDQQISESKMLSKYP